MPYPKNIIEGTEKQFMDANCLVTKQEYLVTQHRNFIIRHLNQIYLGITNVLMYT